MTFIRSSACMYNTYNQHVDMLHDTIKYEAVFKCLVDDVSSKRLPVRPNGLSPKRLVAQTTVDRREMDAPGE